LFTNHNWQSFTHYLVVGTTTCFYSGFEEIDQRPWLLESLQVRLRQYSASGIVIGQKQIFIANTIHVNNVQSH